MNFINPNIKARRLIFLKIVWIFMGSDPGKKYGFNVRFFNFCREFDIVLDSHLKGSILFENGVKSAVPYVDLAVQFGILHSSEGKYERSKSLSFSIQNIEIGLDSKDLEQLFQIVIEKDGWGMLLTVILLNRESISYNKIKYNFEILILDLITRVPENHYLWYSLDEISKKFLNKFNLDSFLLPRINWLVDLKIIDLKYQPTTKKQILELVIIPSLGCLKISNEIGSELNSLADFDFNALIAKFDLRVLQHGN